MGNIKYKPVGAHFFKWLGSKVTELQASDAEVAAVTGALADLTTTAKTNLVAAVNEVDGHADAALAKAGGTMTGDITLTDGEHILTGTSSGSKIFGSDSAKGALWGATPVVRQAHIADAKTDYTTGDLDAESEIIAALNATNGKLNAILARLEVVGISLDA